MNATITQKIEDIKNGIVPNGYKKTNLGIIPNNWEVNNFKEVFKIISNNTLSRANLNYIGGTFLNIHYGDILIKYDEYLDCKNANGIPFINDNVKIKEEVLLQEGDIVFADTAEDYTVGKAVEIISTQDKKIVSGLHTIPCRPLKKFASKWLGYFCNSDAYHKQIKLLATGIKVTSISKASILQTFVLIPPLAEQQKIAEILETQDKLIKLQERLIEEYKKLKKYFLSKMFPKKGCLYPEIRFPEFTEPWEEYKLCQLVNYLSSNLTVADSLEFGKYDLYDANNVIGKTNREPVKLDYITVIKDGAGVGRIRKLPKNTLFIGTMGALITSNSSLNFIFSLLTRFSLSNEFSGSTIPHIYFKDYGNNYYFIPKLAEQKEIGELFDKIDNLITLYQRKLDEMKIYKKALIQLLLTGIVRVNSD